MTTSKLGITVIKEFEQLRLNPYDDGAGKLTIGWGHLIKKGEQFTTISPELADTMLANDLKEAEMTVSALVTVPLSQWQYDALVSFTFNTGPANLERSTLLTCLNKGRYALAANEFERWVYAGGNKMAGLMARRRCEKVVFKAGTEKEG